jgi:B12-binding domain/radical SAM domain protein
MSQDEILLIHPPSVWDFRERAIFYGPISDVIPSTPLFEMYPVGFLTLAAYLRRHGFRVRIINLALKMMREPDFAPEPYLARLRPLLFGIDLHWLPHVHGSLALAGLLKTLHPDVPTVLGGISASYFHEELIRESGVDFVLRGSVCEPFLLALVRQLKGARDFSSVPNLDWKSEGSCHSNPAAPAPGELDDYDFDLGMMVRQVLGRLDFWTNVPFQTWWRHPITAVFTVRGCDRGCVTCGASNAAFKRYLSGHYPLRRSPRAVVAQVSQLATMTRAPIFLVGDLQDGGEDYAQAVVDGLARSRVTNRITFEFFAPPPATLIEQIDRSLPHWAAELSPESHDERIRELMGKALYSNAQLEASIETILATRCEQLDLFFMVGLPEQTYDSVMDGIRYIEGLFHRFDRRLSAFMTPMGPFLDPGSDGFELGEEIGYSLFARTLKEHRALWESSDWEHILGYQTRWMTRRDIVNATYDGAERLNELKVRYERISPELAAGVAARLDAARDLKRQIERPEGNPSPMSQSLMREVRMFSQATLNDKRELFPPGAFLRNFRIGGVVKLLWQDLFRRRS